MSLILLRHAWAGDRDEWAGDDRLRPLDDRGRAQAAALARELAGVGRALSSPYVRCVQTVEPIGLPVEIDDRLTEGAGRDAVLELANAVEDGVLCTHGDVVESVLGRSLEKGEYVVLRR